MSKRRVAPVANKWLKRTPPSVTPPAGEAGRRRATLRLRRLATPLGVRCLWRARGLQGQASQMRGGRFSWEWGHTLSPCGLS